MRAGQTKIILHDKAERGERCGRIARGSPSAEGRGAAPHVTHHVPHTACRSINHALDARQSDPPDSVFLRRSRPPLSPSSPFAGQNSLGSPSTTAPRRPRVFPPLDNAAPVFLWLLSSGALVLLAGHGGAKTAAAAAGGGPKLGLPPVEGVRRALPWVGTERSSARASNSSRLSPPGELASHLINALIQGCVLRRGDGVALRSLFSSRRGNSRS